MTYDTRNDIIDGALETIGVKMADESSEAADVLTAKNWLNRMVKRLQSTGAHLWTRNSATLFLSAGVNEYLIGTTADATESYVETTTTAALAAAATTIPVTSATGMTVGDLLGVRLDDGTINFSIITTITVLDIEITDGLVSAAASGNVVYNYTTRLGKALRIPDARRKNDSQEIEMLHLGRSDYLELPNKDNQGTPVQYYYDPKQDNGKMFLWPTPISGETLVTFSYYKPLDVFTTSSDVAEFPDEWIEALVLNLAIRLAPIFGRPIPPGLQQMASQAAQDALDWDQEDASIYLTPSKTRG